jgi:hypothetical protein
LTTIKRILAYSKIYRKYGLSLFNHAIKREKERTSEISKVGGKKGKSLNKVPPSPL